MTIYCPTCNNSSDDIRFVGNFCENCVKNKLELNFPVKVTIRQCRFCERIKEGQTFSPMKNAALSRAIRIELGLKCDVKVRRFTDRDVNADFIFEVGEDRVSVNKTLAMKIAHETCQRCYQIKSGYYEAVVQLRGNRMKIEKLQNNLAKFIDRRGGFIAKVEMVENGEDIYTSDKLGTHEFMHEYRLKPIRSYRLYGVKNGRKVYRNTYSLHL